MAKHFTYKEIILFWRYSKEKKAWIRRSRGIVDNDNFNLVRGTAIGYIPTILPVGENGIEKFALYLLILHVTGPTSFDDIKTINNIKYNTFKEAAIAKNLLERDDEFDHVLKDAFTTLFGRQLRRFFAILLSNWAPKDSLALWLNHRDRLCEDFIRKEKKKLNPSFTMDQMYDKALLSINFYLDQLNSSLKAVGLPVPKNIDSSEQVFSFFYETDKTESDLNQIYESLNEDQKTVFDSITDSAINNKGKFCFIDAPGGTGKTFLLNSLIDKLSFDGKKVCPTASSGIAGILLKGGGTLHSKLKVPFTCNENSVCDIRKQSDLAKKIKDLDCVIWDEAPMFNKNILECLDRTLRDLRDSEKLFGGITMVLSGDWRQILPVVINGSRAQIIDATHKRSELWDEVNIFNLSLNMRVTSNDADAIWFKDFLLNVGNGNLNPRDYYEMSQEITIPERFILRSEKVIDLVDKVYTDIDLNVGNEGYIKWVTERAVIAPTNKDVDAINKICLDKLPGHEITLLSMDQNELIDSSNMAVSVDLLHSFNEGGLPPHELKLKLGAPVILLRNLCPSEGHCNGTRYIVTRINSTTLELQVAAGCRQGELFVVPRIKLFSTGGKNNISFSRKQFPIKLAFAFTAHKAQGQSLNHVGVCAKKDFFTHGQFYVAISRSTRPENLYILLRNININKTVNVVYEEILQ